MAKRHRFNLSQIRTLRELSGLSPDEFGSRIGRTGRSILNWEQDKTSPTLRDLETICREFHVDLSGFLTREPVGKGA